MKSTTLFMAALASTAIAQPHGHGYAYNNRKARHLHQEQYNKRAQVTAWETAYVTETVIEYIDETTTVWITPGATTVATTLATVTSAVSSSSATNTPGQFFEAASSSSSSSAAAEVAPDETPVATPVTVAPTTSTTPTPTPETTTYVAPVVESPAPVVTPSTTEVVAQTPVVTANALVATAAATTNTDANSYAGDLTYYQVGMGACGWDDSGKDKTDNIIALSHLVMGSQSNGNPYCGKTVTITNPDTGASATGTVRDKCMGCIAGAIDVSEKMFSELGDMSAGRIPVKWVIN